MCWIKEVISHVISWVTAHWGLFALLCTAIGGPTIMFFLNRSHRIAQTKLANAQRGLIEQQNLEAKNKRKQDKQFAFDYQISSLAGTVLMWMDAEKKRLNVSSVVISENTLKTLLGTDADKLPLVMRYLMDKKKATFVTPGQWSLK
jgi:hypothetical protein